MARLRAPQPVASTWVANYSTTGKTHQEEYSSLVAAERAIVNERDGFVYERPLLERPA